MTCNKSKPIQSQVFFVDLQIFLLGWKMEIKENIFISTRFISKLKIDYESSYSDNNEFFWNEIIHILPNINILNNILCSKISEFLLIQRCLTFSFNSFKSFILDPMTLFNLVLNGVVTTLIQKWIHNYFRQDFDMLRNLFISYLSVCWKEKVVFKSH